MMMMVMMIVVVLCMGSSRAVNKETPGQGTGLGHKISRYTKGTSVSTERWSQAGHSTLW